MENNIKQILEDIYSVDKNLKKHEKELIEIIKTLIASRPEAKYDENFKSQLRIELLEKFNQIYRQKSENKKSLNFNFMNKFIYGAGILALALIILVPGLISDKQKQANVNFGLEIARLSNNAFGSLTNGSGSAAHGLGAGGDSVANGVAKENAGFGGGGGSAAMAGDIGIMPPIIYYNYIYQGDPISLENEQLTVYKKIKGLSSSQSELASLLKNIQFDGLDLKSFANTKLTNFQISEDKNFGYNVYVDLYEGMVSISENWLKWPQNEVYTPLSINDVPSDEILINMADRFLSEKKVDLSQFGEPRVEDSWRIYYERNAGQDYYGVPEYMSVIYPQKINDQEIYEEWGNPYGLRVNINIRQKRASGIWGISSQKYQGSMYAMETDASKILQLANQGGGWPMYKDTNAQTVDIKLGTPRMGYTVIWQYKNNESQQLYVPALIFPVVEQPSDGYFYREKVVVPLAKELVNERLNPNYPDDRPIPL